MNQSPPPPPADPPPLPAPAPLTPPPPSSPPPTRRAWAAAVWSGGQFVVALAATVGVLVYLLNAPAPKPEEPPDDRGTGDEPVTLAGPWLIRVAPDTPLAAKLQTAEIHPTRVTAPGLTVTGTVVASLRPGKGDNGNKGGWASLRRWLQRPSDYWQFNSAEVLTTYTDWQKAKADIAFASTQLLRVREAAVARTAAQREIVATTRRLEAGGTETKKQLAIEAATLRQYEIQEQKEIYEAETAIRIADRAERATARQLQQAGLDPSLLGSVTSDVDLVMADVPEGFLGRVNVGDGCEARFFGVPEQVFIGRVKSIAPVLARDRRSLRVLFTVDDFRDQLRPGMFAEIGLGTDARDALLAPGEGVVHVGRADYMLVAAPAAGAWRVTQVEVGELRGSRVEVLRGLNAGDRVLGQGSILLKPVIAKAVATVNGGGP
ncbi:efflux RND transporter periplasmic adaptor subunit [Gemmata sp. JC673]|uniref:Efflux RND transporter periplasmic adaptor subunit n=1 Tax=Gemmata algarum TaxID=2975278 RepID=A0ABU5F4F9_9BACT|nr:efflux RND transporter periplasmic adaptor subunit [Gemmata algarum]MDY3561088.1 efflux RND transporter periplasmic adaptor subunit [Gemmata algarum]